MSAIDQQKVGDFINAMKRAGIGYHDYIYLYTIWTRMNPDQKAQAHCRKEIPGLKEVGLGYMDFVLLYRMWGEMLHDDRMEVHKLENKKRA